jgi:hypothetical protein
MIKNIKEKLEKMTGHFDADYWIVFFSKMFNSLMSDVDSFLSVRWWKKFRKPYCELNKVLEKL